MLTARWKPSTAGKSACDFRKKYPCGVPNVIELIELFQRDCDINKFNKIALSNPEDLSHLDRMNELFSQGVVDVFEDDVLSSLVNSSKLWEDLEI